MKEGITVPKLIDKIVAIVDNTVILESDVNRLIKLININLNHKNNKFIRNKSIRYQIIDNLIVDQLYLNYSRNLDIQISNIDLEQEIMNIAKKYGLTINQIKNKLNHANINFNIYKQQIYKKMIISETVNNEISNRINILPQEIETLANQIYYQNYNKEFNLNQFSILLPENINPIQFEEAKDKAFDVIDKINHGFNINEIKIMNSKYRHPILINKINWSNINDIPSIFAQALLTAKRGDIIGPINSGSGLHILQINDIRINNLLENSLDKEITSIPIVEVRIRHILLKTSPILNNDQANNILKQVYLNIKHNNISFSKAVKEFSQDLESVYRDGDLGWNPLNIYHPVIRDTILKLNKGEISKPILSPIGWHIIQLIDIKNLDEKSALKNLAYQILFNRQFLEEEKIWMQELRANAYIKILNY